MPGLRRCLHGIAVASRAVFAPVVAVVIHVVERVRVAGNGQARPEAAPGSTVVAFVPRPRAFRRDEPRRAGSGAVVILFPGRRTAITAPSDPSALAG